MSRRHVLGLALAGLALGPSGCKRGRDEGQAGAEAKPVRAELWIAPVADEHPWVIALVTRISIERPPGADARLEGLAGPAAMRSSDPVPDPIIEAEDREALAAFLADYEAAHPRPPELRPVWEADPFGPDAKVRARLFFIDRSRGFAVDDQARASLRRPDPERALGPSVRVELGPDQTRALAELSAEIVGHRLGFALGDEALMLPVVAEPIPDGDVQLLTRTSEDPNHTAPALLARLTRGS